MSKTKRADGWWYPWVFVAGFGVVIAVNSTLAYFAVNSWTGLENAHPFQAGQAFNEELAQKSAQANLGWRVQPVFEATPATEQSAHTGVMRMTFTGPDGKSIDNLVIEAMAVRPTSEGHDQALAFTAQGKGTYVAPIDLPLAGQWELRITATRGADVFKMRPRIQVP
ncbi:MAG TPA: FixH family protein [Magnetovibrio sp.]